LCLTRTVIDHARPDETRRTEHLHANWRWSRVLRHRQLARRAGHPRRAPAERLRQTTTALALKCNIYTSSRRRRRRLCTTVSDFVHHLYFPTLRSYTRTHTHTHPFNGPFSGTTRVSRYQKGITNLDFTEARDSGWQWHLLGHMQVCISLHQITTPAPHTEELSCRNLVIIYSSPT